MSIEKDTEIKSRYEDYSVEELKEALNAIFDSTDEFSDSDVEQMDEIMAVLNRKNPLPRRYTAEESLKHFLENHSEELSRLGVRNTGEVMEEAEKATGVDTAVVVPVIRARRTITEPTDTEAKHVRSSRKLLRAALFAAAVVALMVIITVSAAAAGFNIWGWVPVWNDSTFKFVPEDSVTSLDIPAALKQLGIEEPMFPTWLPEGFILEEQQIILDENAFLHAVYVCKDRMIMITISYGDDVSGAFVVEKNSGDPVEYNKKGHTHFIVSNYEKEVAVWQVEEYSIRIFGDLTVDEIEKMIDSVYEVVK